MSDQWKTKYLQTFTTAGGPFSGAFTDVPPVFSGDTQGLPGNPNLWYRGIMQRLSGVVWMLPDSDTFKDTKILTDEATGTVYDGSTLLAAIAKQGATDTIAISKSMQTAGIFTSMKKAPGVKTFVTFGQNVETKESFTYRKIPADSDPTEIKTSLNGDGTVPFASLDIGSKWAKEQKQQVETQAFDGATHLGLVGDQRWASFVINDVIGFSAPRPSMAEATLSASMAVATPSACAGISCGWNTEHACPGQRKGAKGWATNDGTIGFQCCCTGTFGCPDPTQKDTKAPGGCYSNAIPGEACNSGRGKVGQAMGCVGGTNFLGITLKQGKCECLDGWAVDPSQQFAVGGYGCMQCKR